MHKAQKRSVTVICTLLITSGVKVSQIPFNWYVGGETNPFLGMLAFGNTSGQDVESAPHCLPATRGHHSSYLTGYCLFRLLNLVAYVIRTCFYRIFTPFRLIFHLSEATIPP